MRTKDRKIEVDHYDEIAKALSDFFVANLEDGKKYVVKVLIGEISSGIRTLIANGYDAGKALTKFGKSVHKLHLDISLLIENTEKGNFEIIIFEIKKTKRMGLTELSQLIGYCLVSKAKFGVLVNVDNSVSGEFSVILDADKDLTQIIRVIDEKTIEHKFGVMIWNSKTLKMEYTQSGAIKSMPSLVEMIISSLE